MASVEPASSASGASVVHKAVAGVFVTVLAPVLVAFGVKFSDTLLIAKPEPDKNAATAPAAAATPAAAASGAAAIPATGAAAATGAPAATPPVAASSTATTAPPTSVAAAPAATGNAPKTAPLPPAAGAGSSTSSSPTSPAAEVATSEKDGLHFPHFKKPTSPVVRLFNGRDLTGFYTYLGSPQSKGKPYGKDYDPEKVFSVEGGQLVVSGEVLGTIETVKEYSDYWLSIEYKWGERTWAPRADEARHSAILLNVDGPDGAIHGAFPISIHCQIIEGTTGDLLLATGRGEHHLSLTAAAEEHEVGHGSSSHMAYFYKPGQPFTTLTSGIVKRYPPAMNWRDIKGIQSPGDIERPHGQWNTLDIVTLDGKIFVQLNDHVVNFAKQVAPDKGRIGIQSNGAEIIFRSINLQQYQKGKSLQVKK